MTPSSSKSLSKLVGAGNHNIHPLHDTKDLDVVVQRLRYFAFLEHNGNLWYPFVILTEDLPCPAGGFYQRFQLAALEGSHVSLTIAHHGFGVDPHACFKYCSNLIFPCTPFFPASNFCTRPRRRVTICLCLKRQAHIESIHDVADPKVFQKRILF